LTRAAKEEQIAAIRDHFSRATAAVLVDFRGLDVESATELRTEFRNKGVDYKVVKNTLVRLALKGTELEGNAELDGYLVGPTGIAWSYEDPSAAAKVIKSFREQEERADKLAVKCGVLDNQVMNGEQVENELATLPGKDEIRAMLLAQLQAPAQSLLRQLNAAAQNFAYALDARQRQLEDNS
jgi:large subunit ribosomal protein L10